jgi:predicted metal-dependent enzyme (double-stranded beta helix superfamily)
MADKPSTEKEESMVTESKSQNALERFISKTRELFAREPDLDKRWAALTPILAELLADPEVLEASKGWPDCVPAEGRAENLLFYEDPDYGFAINGLTKGTARQGQRARIHDHAHIYTLYGVLAGHERIERYERLDDRSRPGYAEIRKTTDLVVGPGEIDLVKPREIHTEVTVGERTVAVIIRSEKGGGFNQGRYNPEANEYYESLGPRQTPVEMLARRAKTEQGPNSRLPL